MIVILRYLFVFYLIVSLGLTLEGRFGYVLPHLSFLRAVVFGFGWPVWLVSDWVGERRS